MYIYIVIYIYLYIYIYIVSCLVHYSEEWVRFPTRWSKRVLRSVAKFALHKALDLIA